MQTNNNKSKYEKLAHNYFLKNDTLKYVGAILLIASLACLAFRFGIFGIILTILGTPTGIVLYIIGSNSKFSDADIDAQLESRLSGLNIDIDNERRFHLKLLKHQSDILLEGYHFSDGVMLTQIRDISGIDSSTLQNWTKRGWVVNSRSKKYNMDQVAHILIINMLRSCMQLDRIAFLIRYINGNVNDPSDDIICASQLYDYICRILERLTDDVAVQNIRECIEGVLSDYEEKVTGARKRLSKGLEIIVIAYYASLLKGRSDALLENLT